MLAMLMNKIYDIPGLFAIIICLLQFNYQARLFLTEFLCLQLRFLGYLIVVWRLVLKELEYCSGLQWASVCGNNPLTVI